MRQMCKEIAIAGIVILDAIALWNGIDGVLLLTSLAAIAGIGGYELGGLQKRRKK